MVVWFGCVVWLCGLVVWFGWWFGCVVWLCGLVVWFGCVVWLCGWLFGGCCRRLVEWTEGGGRRLVAVTGRPSLPDHSTQHLRTFLVSYRPFEPKHSTQRLRTVFRLLELCWKCETSPQGGNSGWINILGRPSPFPESQTVRPNTLGNTFFDPSSGAVGGIL